MAAIQLREQLLRDALGDCLPLAHVDSVVAHTTVDSISARQELCCGLFDR
jgi:hypothetical protein